MYKRVIFILTMSFLSLLYAEEATNYFYRTVTIQKRLYNTGFNAFRVGYGMDGLEGGLLTSTLGTGRLSYSGELISANPRFFEDITARNNSGDVVTKSGTGINFYTANVYYSLLGFGSDRDARLKPFHFQLAPYLETAVLGIPGINFSFFSLGRQFPRFSLVSLLRSRFTA